MAESEKKPPTTAKNKLLSLEPARKKFITELFHAFANRKLSFAELTSLDPNKIKQVAEMGYVKLRHGRFEEARKIFEVLTFLDHKNYFHHLALGGAYQKLKKYIDAIFQYGETLKISPGNLNALVNRGEVFLRHKNYRKAAEDFREAILLDKSGQDRFANRARSLVIAIKRSLAKDKAAKDLPAAPKKQAISAAAKKAVNPLKLVK